MHSYILNNVMPVGVFTYCNQPEGKEEPVRLLKL